MPKPNDSFAGSYRPDWSNAGIVGTATFVAYSVIEAWKIRPGVVVWCLLRKNIELGALVFYLSTDGYLQSTARHLHNNVRHVTDHLLVLL